MNAQYVKRKGNEMNTSMQQVSFVESSQIEDFVYATCTTDYDVFVFDPTNRAVDRSLVESLKLAIQEHNLLRSYPIVIASVDGVWVVRDGQHRLTAAKELGVPIYYTFNDEMTARDVINVNVNRKGWTVRNYLDSYCASGHVEYLKLREFMQRFPWLTITTAKDLCWYGDRNMMGFNDGKYVCNDIEFAEQVAQAALQFSRWVTFYHESLFVRSVSNLLEHEGYDHKRMLRKMEYRSKSLVKCVSIEEYMTVFGAIYNYKESDADKLQLGKLNSQSKARREDRRSRFAKKRVG